MVAHQIIPFCFFFAASQEHIPATELSLEESIAKWNGENVVCVIRHSFLVSNEPK